MNQVWEKAAQAKGEAILARIPKEWILDEIPIFLKTDAYDIFGT
jgi:hypothetical protein